MCYIIKSKQSFVFDSMTATIEKKYVLTNLEMEDVSSMSLTNGGATLKMRNKSSKLLSKKLRLLLNEKRTKLLGIDSLKVWLTSNYDYLGATQDDIRDFPYYKFNVPFGEIYSPRIRFKETIIKPLNCKLSDIEYISKEQCLVNIFITERFSACPLKCVPIQMNGFQYVNYSASVIKCNRVEDEICMGGPKVWIPLLNEFSNCPKPCKITTYKDSRRDLTLQLNLKGGQNLAHFELVKNNVRNTEKEVLVYDLNDVIVAIGGSLGLFLGFSFFDLISKCLDNLLMPFVNYLISSRVVADQSLMTPV